MKTIKELLLDADPLRHESAVVQEQRAAARAAILAAAGRDPERPLRSPRRLMRVALVSAVVSGMVLLGSLLWPRMGLETHATVRFEIRLAEDAPAPGLQEARVSGSDKSVYLHEEIVADNSDVFRAKVSKDQIARVAVLLQFTKDGTQKISAATQGHVGRPLAILIDGSVVMAPILQTTLGDSAQVTGMTMEEAERIVNGMK